MKNLLTLFLLLPFFAIGQIHDPCYSISDYNLLTQEVNPSLVRDLSEGWNILGYPCLVEIDAIVAFEQIVDKVLIVKDNDGAVYMPEFGFNGIGNLVALHGYQIKLNAQAFNFSFCEGITLSTIEGCTDCVAFNFNALATTDNGSCEYQGCMDETACNYSPEANMTDGSCSYPEENYDCEGNYFLPSCPYPNFFEYNEFALNTDVSMCITPIIAGCMDLIAENYNSNANLDDESCEYIYGCTLDLFPNYNSQATVDDGSCDMNSTNIYGCTDSSYFEWNEFANIENQSCDSIIIYGCSYNFACNYNPDANFNDSTCVYAFDGLLNCNNSSIQVGDLYQGGIVFYIDETGEHGLIASVNNYGDIWWASNGTPKPSYYYAIEFSEELSVGGYNDWYLPDNSELTLMYNNIGPSSDNGNIGGFIVDNTGSYIALVDGDEIFPSDYWHSAYHSSSISSCGYYNNCDIYPISNTHTINMKTGYVGIGSANNAAFFRPIRSF